MRFKQQDISYFIRNAPLTMFSTALPGAVNYGIILILSFFYRMEDVGIYRMLISGFALMGLVALQEGGKVFIRAHAENDSAALAALFMARFYVCVAVCAVVCALALFSVVPWILVSVAFLILLICPCDLFTPILQSQKQFVSLAVAVGAKYTGSFFVFLIVMGQTHNASYAALALFITMALFNILYFYLWVYPLLKGSIKNFWGIKNIVRDKNSRDAFILSAANFLPSTLEHFDKLIIGFVFGLDVLGIYTLAFSTGRFIYNALKPAFYIYYRQFVDALPHARILVMIASFFTCIGVTMGMVFHFVVVPLFPQFKAGEVVTLILFASYGVAMADALYCQSYSLYKKASSFLLLKTNTLISILCLLSFSLCFFVEPQTALVIAAAHFPLSHGGSIFLLSRYSRRA